MSTLFHLAVLATLAGLAMVGWLAFSRARDGRRELARRLHDGQLALDRRCDALQAQLDAIVHRQRVDHMLHLVGHGEADGVLAPAVARRLRRYIFDLRREGA